MPFLRKIGQAFLAYWKHYGALKAFSFILACYILTWSFAEVGTFGTTGGFVSKPPGYIIDPASEERTEAGIILTKGSERPIVAANDLQMFCLGVTRASAFFMYPSLVLVFTTKFRATMEIIMQSPLSMFTYQDLHELHIYCGWVIVLDGVLHTIFHCIRWGNQGNMYLMFDTVSGISGIVCIICILLIGIPMMFEAFRKRIAYELRKYLHYFFIVFCIAMSFHAPLSTIPNGGFTAIVFPTLICWYALDALYVHLYMTEKIDTTIFHAVATGVMLTMTVSESFQRRGGSGGYCYVNFPWINKNQWHAFSLFENPANPNERQIYIQDLGDWTHSVLEALQRDTHRPVWVQGPFSSPYDSAIESDNQILVAGGIGITPAISVMRKHKETRRTNLIWSVRDPHMLEFFVKHGEFSSRGWNLVFYTGKQPLYVGDADEIMTSSGALVHIIRARPNFDDLIPNIIYSIESGEFVPEAFMSEVKADAIDQLKEKVNELDKLPLTSHEKVTELINYSDGLGFLFTDLMLEVAKLEGGIAEHLQSVKSSVTKKSQVTASDVGKGKVEKEENLGEDELLEKIRSTSKLFPSELEGDGGFTDFLKFINTPSEQVGDKSAAEKEEIMGEDELLEKIRSTRNLFTSKLEVLDGNEDAGKFENEEAGKSTRRRVSFLSTTAGLSRSDVGTANIHRSLRHRRSSKVSKAWYAFGSNMSDWIKDEVKMFRPWKEDSVEAKEFVKALDRELVLSTWGALYCGGQGPLADALKKTTKEFGISVALESFKW